MTSNDTIARGDNVNICSMMGTIPGTVIMVWNNGKNVLVRHDDRIATEPPRREFTLRADGRWVIKGKKTSTWNTEYLDVTASGL